MHPILFEIGGFPVYTYGLLLAAAYLLGLQFAVVRGRKRGLNPNQIMDLGIWIIVSALVGAKLMLVVVERDKFGWNWQELLNLFRSAGVFYGGLIAAISVALWYMWRHKMPTWTVTDVFAPGIALGHVVGRLGCLFAGCCFGKPTTMPWGITFHDKFAEQNAGTTLGIPLHPTQLYEAGAELPHPGRAASDRAKGPSVSRSDVLELHVPLRRLALRDRVLSRRFARNDWLSVDVAVDLAVHLAVDRPDQSRHVGGAGAAHRSGSGRLGDQTRQSGVVRRYGGRTP